MIPEAITMPFPAAWARGLFDVDAYEALDDASASACQIMIEQLRHDGYKVLGLASAQAYHTNHYRLCGGDADTGMVLDCIVRGGHPIPKERDLL